MALRIDESDARARPEVCGDPFFGKSKLPTWEG